MIEGLEQEADLIIFEDGPWYHGDERGWEPAVLHFAQPTCRAAGRHPKSACGLTGGVLRDRMEAK